METTHAAFASHKERWIERFARFGIYSKGVVYCIIGVLSTMAALGLRGQKAGKSDAFKVIYDQPFGKILLIAVGVGLLGYVTWRFFQSVYDIDSKGSDAKATFIRIGYAFSGVLYLGLSIYAIRLAFGNAGSGDGDSQQFIVSKVLEYGAGVWIIGIAAVLTILNGFRQIYKGASRKFMKNVHMTNASRTDLYKKAGMAGYVARGVVLLIVGYFFLRAALHHNAKEAIGTKEAFSFMENTFGSVLMGLVAVGLVGYGIFMFIKGRYQTIDLNF